MKSLKNVGIVLLNSFSGPGIGGGEVRLLNMARACKAAGMHVHIICEPGGDLAAEARASGVTVAPYRLGRRNLLRTVSRIRKYIVRNGIGIVHSGGVLADALARLATRRLPVCVVTTVQGQPGAAALDGAGRRGVWLRRQLERATRRRTDRFVCACESIARAVVADGVPELHVVVAYNGVRVSEVRADAAQPLPVALPKGSEIVGCVARLEPVKGVDVFLRAAARIADRMPDVRFVVVGDGSQRDSLGRLAIRLGIADRVVFVGALAHPEPVLGLLDVVAVPSRSEGLPTVVLEAMALERPIAASAVGGIPEVVTDRETGVLVPPDDPESLAAAIEQLLADPERAAAMGRAGQARVIDHFSLDDQMRRYLAVFRLLLADAQKRS